MRTLVAPFVVIALLACSKDGGDTKKADAAPSTASANASASAAAPADGGFALAPPPADDWQEVKLAKAKVKLRVPGGATVPSDRAGHDAKFAGSFFRVVLPSGYDVYFAERHGSADAGADVTAEKLAFRARTKGKGVFLYEADDAMVVVRDEGPPAGKYCETTACGKLSGRPICAIAAGARIDGTQVKKLTETECLAVVTIARSIHEL
jgi:hypothetical protein